MRQLPAFALLLAAAIPFARAGSREMQFDQAQKIALIVAQHDNIAVDDRNFVLNSMDTRTAAGFIPGYYSFSIIREGTSPGQADETIRMYIVSKRTADTWELNLCTHYSFPELKRIQQTVMQETGATPNDEHDMPKTIGCRNQTQAQTNPAP
ncbi:MAG TPA: hypothetical protein VGM27_27330 [Acidobacteriaceae bacterium]